jgi:short-subunit dehydrogenase
MTSAKKCRNVFLTGASAGIGRAMALRLMEEGYEVWGTSRHVERLQDLRGLHPIVMDFADLNSVKTAWHQAVEEAGEIDILIQNAGSGLFGPLEETSVEQAQQEWRILVEGPCLLMQLAARDFRAKGRGWIVGISSLAAEMPIPFFAHYNAGKAALSAMLASLWIEMKPYGVRVVDFRPGDICTSFNQSVRKTEWAGSPYQEELGKAWLRCEHLIGAAPKPEWLAKKMVALLQQKNPKPIYRAGSFFQAVLGPLGVRLFSRYGLLQSIRSYYQLDRHS